MKSFILFSLAVVCCVSLMIATERRALAYVDPGSGLLALQSLAAALASGAYFLRRRIAALFGRNRSGVAVELPAGVRKPAVAPAVPHSDNSRSAA